MQETTDSTNTPSTPTKFVCPNCGVISQDDVVFLCNHCKQEELVLQDGMYMCPACFIPGDNFECMLCGSKKVKLEHDN